MTQVIIDVREKDEFDAEHVEHSIHLPLSHFASVAPGILNSLRDREVLLMCRSGNRARLAFQQIGQLGYDDKVSASVFDGGILEWKKQGKPVIANRKGHLPIIRQVHLIAGSTVLITALLSYFVDARFALVAAFFGAGLSFAGATGFCGMATLLAKMPWNRSYPGTREQLCQVSPSSGICNS